MICPKCGVDDNGVSWGKEIVIGADPAQFRRRTCHNCGQKFDTIERVRIRKGRKEVKNAV